MNMRWVYLGAILLSACGTTSYHAVLNRASLTVENLSSYAICEVKVGDGRSAHEQLDAGRRVSPGRWLTVPVNAGEWSVVLKDCRGELLLARRGVRVNGPTTLTFEPVEVTRHPYRGSRHYSSRTSGGIF